MASPELKTINKYFRPAFTVSRPTTTAGRFIFSSPHSGRIYPPEFIKNSPLSDVELRSSEDAYVDELFCHVPNQGAHFITALVPRAYLDLNRHPYELDPKLFAGQLPAFARSDSSKVTSGIGVIARIVSKGKEIYKNSLDVNEALKRINHLYFPYHGALRELINANLNLHRQAILIDCHSMPSGPLPGFKKKSPDFVLGNRFDKSCDYELTHLVRAKLQATGYHVSVNKPYAGGYVTKKYGNPQKGVHTLQIEINRHLYLDERTLEKNSGFDELRQNLRNLTKALTDELPDLADRPPLAAE